MLFFVEHTDTFAGEANHCWVNRFKVEAETAKQALTKVKKEIYFTPLPRHKLSDYGDMLRADIGNEVFFVEEWEENHEQYKVKEIS